MTITRRSFVGTGLVAGIAARAGALSSPANAATAPLPGLLQPQATIDLWPEGAPGAPARPLDEVVIERSADPRFPDRAVYGISRPRLAVFRAERPSGAAVVIMPGGGYRWVAADKEGYEMARWLAARDVTAFVLFYRLPGERWAAGADTPLQDAQRAMRVVRSRASEFALAPDRVAAMGFSAGGHVCADLAARFAVHVYEPADAADRLSARPACAAAIYPVVSMDAAIAHPGSRALLLGANPAPALEAAHSPDRNVPADAPPHFLLHAEDDTVVPVANTLRLRAALKARGVRVETHLFEHGGHGFGLRQATGKPVAIWPELWRAWAQTTALG